MPNLSYLVDTLLAVEKLRVATQVRESHLELNEHNDPDTIAVRDRLQATEDWLTGRVAEEVKSHPAQPWFSRVKGIGQENIGKVAGLVDIRKAGTISSLWKFAGYAPGADRRKKGEKIAYNAELKTMVWRLGTSLMKAQGCFAGFYYREKEAIRNGLEAKGMKILPTPTGRLCPTCGLEVKKKDTFSCPTDGSKLALKEEPEGIIFDAHLHMMAFRKMCKLFLACLWLEWRTAEGLAVSQPYAFGPLQHSHEHLITPEEMTDR